MREGGQIDLVRSLEEKYIMRYICNCRTSWNHNRTTTMFNTRAGRTPRRCLAILAKLHEELYPVVWTRSWGSERWKIHANSTMLLGALGKVLLHVAKQS